MAINLTPDQLRQVDKTLREIHDLRGDIDKAEACGLDCTNHRQVCDFCEEKLTKIKMAFPPEKYPR